jgi:CRISPR/Cas system CSM-associated protein Csm2 small subunit
MDKKRIFYVCSYGGSGSKMLCYALNRYGMTKHIHSRLPPNKLEYIGRERGGRMYDEWFNGVVIPEDELENYCVIYIYRNPSFSIPSRFTNPAHLEHIQTDKSIKLADVLSSNKDLYKIREFYENYTKPNKERNYKIYCIKYEDIFDKQDEISNLLGIGKLNLVNRSLRKDSNEELDRIYADLIDEMNKNDFIMIS